jgi:hypothetical protein
VTLAEAFERETGCALHERELFGRRVLVPADDRFGAFALVTGPAPQVAFRVRSYGGVHLVLLGGEERKLDRILRRLSA